MNPISSSQDEVVPIATADGTIPRDATGAPPSEIERYGSMKEHAILVSKLIEENASLKHALERSQLMLGAHPQVCAELQEANSLLRARIQTLQATNAWLNLENAQLRLDMGSVNLVINEQIVQMIALRNEAWWTNLVAQLAFAGSFTILLAGGISMIYSGGSMLVRGASKIAERALPFVRQAIQVAS